MAIWQFNIYFIPKESLKEYKIVQTKLDLEDALEIQWWHILKLNLNEILPLLKQFGKIQEWTARTNGLRKFGDSANNDISVSFDELSNNVLELSCRLDLREINSNIFNLVILIAKKYDCLLMDINGNLFEPTIVDLVNSINISNAKRFITDPIKFLEDINNGNVKLEGYQ